MISIQSKKRWTALLMLAHWSEQPAVWAGKIVAWLYLPLIGIILIDAVSRKFVRKWSFIVDNELHHLFNSPIFQDAEWHIHTVLFLGAIGYAYAHNAHVRLDMFRPRLGVKGRLWVELIGGLVLLIPFLCVFLWYAWDFFFIAWLQDEGSGVSTGIENRWFIKFFIFAGPALLFASGLSKVLRVFIRLFGPPELRTQTQLDALVDESHSSFN